MWGSSFADLAKKAQALQEQASTMSTGEFFNLDGLQSMTDAQKKEKEQQRQNQDAAAASQTQPSFHLPSTVDTAVSPTPKPQASPKGKLKIPKKSDPSQVKGTPQITTEDAVASEEVPSAPGTQDATQSTDNEDVEKQEDVAAEKQIGTAGIENGAKPVQPPQELNDVAPAEEEAEQTITMEKNAAEENSESSSEPVISLNESVPTSQDGNVGEESVTENPKEIENDDVPPQEVEETLEVKEDDTDNLSPSADSEVLNNHENASGYDASTAMEEIAETMDRGGTPSSQSSSKFESSAAEEIRNARENIASMADSEQVMENFTLQLQRLEENFQLERQEMERQHAIALQQAVATKDEDVKQYQMQLNEKDKKVRELLRAKEGNELRLDSLQREVEGTKELLQKKETEIKRNNEENLQSLRKMERKYIKEEQEHGKTKEEVAALKDELLNSKGALGATTDEFSNLKERVRVVAGELKERRTECRELKSKIDELTQVNENLEEQITSLQSQVRDRDLSRTEQDEQVDNLRSTIEELKKQVQAADQSILAKEAEGEKALANYKKKAQNSLAIANSRAAAATQAKEEAEMEARAARNTADTAMKRARDAEANGEEAMVKAKAYYKQMEEEKVSAVAELESSKSELKEVQAKLDEHVAKLDSVTQEKTSLAEEKMQFSRELESERSKCTTLERQLTETRARADALADDVDELRVQLKKAEKASAAATKSGDSKSKKEKAEEPKPSVPEDSNSRATIILLQNQLSEANQTITELKEALHNAITMNENGATSGESDTTNQGQQSQSSGEATSAPLFYAMEKQAELNTARNEINRLASLYADVQSEKNEAEEALEELRRQLNEERAKLERYEKLGSASSSSDPYVSGEGKGNGKVDANGDKGRMNIEYLKNIMLSFLNAKTLAERKALVPVIGAVLCLTPDEQTTAIKNVEAAGGIEGVSSALFESYFRK